MCPVCCLCTRRGLTHTQLKTAVRATEKLLPSGAGAAKDQTLAHFVDWCDSGESRSAAITEVADLQLQLSRALRFVRVRAVSMRVHCGNDNGLY